MATEGGLSEEDMMGGDPRTSQIKVSSGFLLRILAKPLLVPQRGVTTFKMGPGSKWDTRPLLEDQSLGKVLVRTEEGELRQVPVLLILDLGAPWVLGLAKGFRSQCGLCVCLGVSRLRILSGSCH